jgi:hypothetical protein
MANDDSSTKKEAKNKVKGWMGKMPYFTENKLSMGYPWADLSS